MNLGGVLFMLGRLLIALAIIQLVPTVFSLIDRDGTMPSFLVSASIAAASGLTLQQIFRQSSDFRFGRREAFLLVVAAWVTASAMGTIPFVALKGPGFWVDGLFEATSGFTASGATILDDLANEPRSLLFYRALSQWLGGMGIIVLGIAILPRLAIGGMDLLGAEAPGPVAEKLTPRIAQTAKALWGIYVLLTLAAAVTYFLLGMNAFEALTHAFTTLSCGGLSTRGTSLVAFNSPAMELAAMLFMLAAASNFALHFHLLRGRPGPLFRDPEFRFFICVWGGAALLICGDLWIEGVYSGLDALRHGAFQAATITTTTGYATADYDAWPHFSRGLLFLLMCVGGCSGSTTGAVKCVRYLIVVKKIVNDLRRQSVPHAILPVRLGRKAIPDEIVSSVMTFFALYLILLGIGGVVLSSMGLDLVTAFAASAACIGNVGPGFAAVGPMSTYADLPAAGKILLSGFMIAGRLEIYPLLAILFLSRKRGL